MYVHMYQYTIYMYTGHSCFIHMNVPAAGLIEFSFPSCALGSTEELNTHTHKQKLYTSIPKMHMHMIGVGVCMYACMYHECTAKNNS